MENESEAVKLLRDRGYNVIPPADKVYLIRHHGNKTSAWTYTTRLTSPIGDVNSESYKDGEVAELPFEGLAWERIHKE